MQYYEKHKDDVLAELHTTESGLSNIEARQRLQQFGYNVLRIKGESLFKKIVEPFRSVFVAILLFAALLSVFKQEYLDALIVIIIITISAIIYYVQQYSTERVLRALKKHDTQLIFAYREGKEVQIMSEELVPGDVFIVREGEKVPADARIIHASNARTDEAMLTGESEPVTKHHNPLQAERPLYEQVNMVFQGSFIVSGEIKAVVTATGNNTEYGKLAQLAGSSDFESPVQKKIDFLISRIVIAVVVVAIFAFVLQIVRGYDASEALRFVLALAVSAVPEGLPIAISVILVLGMRKLAEKKALVRSMAAIENIGLVTLVATDKTGTLTKNKLSVQDIWELKPNADLREIATAMHHSVLRSDGGISHDPLDEAFMQFSSKYQVEESSLQSVNRLPFNQKHAMSGMVWRIDNDEYSICIKGAPEKIIDASAISVEERQTIEKTLHHLTGQGLRVIAIATQRAERAVATFEELLEQPIDFIGLIAVADELRDEAAGAIAAARDAGVEVAMVTGDHAETAFAIGKKIGLLTHRTEVFDTRQLATSEDHIHKSTIYNSKVFARVTPENKYQLLHYFKKKHITAMTGDGVNDVPALAQAHIGIAMGSGTQVAKEAGDIVLLNDNFSTIIDALREGRVIFANIRKMLFYLLATTIGMVSTMVGSLLIGLPLPVVAIQILWINLVTDTALVIPIGLEPAERDVMKQPPRKPTQPILDRYMITRVIIVGVTMAAMALLVFVYFLQNYSEDYSRTVAFMVLVAMQWANAFNARSDIQTAISRIKVFNGKFAIGLMISISMQLIALFGPLASALHVENVAVAHLVIPSIIAASAVIAVAELHKILRKRNTI
jgi:Ca2+-transporting ATPase